MRALATAVLSTALVLTACGSGSTNGTASTPAPEQVTTSPLAVKTGLLSIQKIAADIVATQGDATQGAKLDEGIEPIWATIEGTVKGNDQDAYIAFEDAFALLEDAARTGNAPKAQRGSTAVSTAVSAYLAKYPA
jgi:hypothetical protein